MDRLRVEGWRGISHSFAVVNQWLLLAMARQQDLYLSVRDLPYLMGHWRARKGLFEPDDERVLAGLPRAEGDNDDATLRISWPYDYTLSRGGRTAVFGTSELGVVPPSYLANRPDITQLAQEAQLIVLTPSRWATNGFLRLGLRQDQVAMIPHGIDPATFRPTPEQRDLVRQRMGCRGFVFMNAGAMTPNKGMDFVLQAFAIVASRRPDVTLLLKGADALYSSAQMLQGTFQRLSASDQQLVSERLIYNGESLSMKQMAALYGCADAYVSPYRGEGFNMPVLEAAACGIPVICTAGGSTDDFVTDDFALKVQSKTAPIMVEGLVGEQLIPNLDHLVAQMLAVMDREQWRRNSVTAGPAHVAAGYTWDNIATRLRNVLFST